MKENKEQKEMRESIEYSSHIPKAERVLLVGVNTDNGEDFRYSMKELKSLVEACHMEVVEKVEQNLQNPTQALYIGTGKLEEIKELASDTKTDVIIFNDTLSPTQLRNLQRELELPVLDRTALILDIFTRRAKTREAKLQVEVASLQYMLPRLVGLHAALSRQGGGSGLANKGAGEKKLELDKRKITHRMHELESELKQVAKERVTQRKKRAESGIPRVALVGYTNAGKSTIMNRMVEAFVGEEEKKVLEQDMLFATLDTTVRRIPRKNNKDFLLSDTVGFISKLPHNLVKAFRSTLEEAREADLLLHVIDFSDVNYKEQLEVTRETLKELEAEHIPTICIYNKADLVLGELPVQKENSIYMSAKTTEGFPQLLEMIEKSIYSDYVNCKLLLPYDLGSITSYLNEAAAIETSEYLEQGILMTLQCSARDYNKYKEYEYFE